MVFLGTVSVPSAVGGVAAAVEFLGQRRPHQGEQLPDLVLKLGGVADEARVEFHLDVDTGTARAVVGLADFLAGADVESQGHGNRQPMFHVSSPLEGWSGPKPARHHDYINVKDFPKCWLKLNLTVEVEAKDKEVAVLKLAGQLRKQESRRSRRKTP